jgi:hypothetical protein
MHAGRAKHGDEEDPAGGQVMGSFQNRCERLTKLVELRAPVGLLVNESRMLLRDHEESDLIHGFYGVRWQALAVWSLACLCNEQATEVRNLKREVRQLKKRQKSAQPEAK